MVQVKVNEGVLEGKTENNYLGGRFHSFRGIPYAEPPVGDLRFKAPIPKQSWDGIRRATEHGPVCYQRDPLAPSTHQIVGSEDCLYLNVYTPDLSPGAPLPVMVFIHGGAFKNGSGDDNVYGPQFLVRHDVILVTINYRVDALGFLCLDTGRLLCFSASALRKRP